MSNHIHIYKVSPGNRKVTVWAADPTTHERIGEFTCKPARELTRIEKSRVIRGYLKTNFGITARKAS